MKYCGSTITVASGTTRQNGSAPTSGSIAILVNVMLVDGRANALTIAQIMMRLSSDLPRAG